MVYHSSSIILLHATAIIYNILKLFIGLMRPENVVVETADGLSSNNQYIVTMQIILTGNGNENISHDVPGCVYDPETPIKLIGIPFLGDFFW